MHTVLDMAGVSVSWLVVLLGMAGSAVGTRYHAVGHSGCYPGYIRQHYTPGPEITSQDRSANLSTLPAEEGLKTKNEIKVGNCRKHF